MKTVWPQPALWLLCAGLLCGGASGLVLAQSSQIPVISTECVKDTACIRTTKLQAQFFPELGSERVLSKYGPLLVPSALGAHDGMHMDAEMDGSHPQMGNFQFVIPAPCTDCVITQYSGGLEYPNGSYANANTGMYLHHAVVYNNNSAASTCPRIAEVFLATGNERTVANICGNGTIKSGYQIHKGDKLVFIAELMNMASQDRDAVITIDWEFVPSIPADFRHAKPVWLDVDGGCFAHGSEVPVPENKTVFSIAMVPAWTAQFSGDILGIGSHLHDGGDDLLTTRNGAVVCTSKARYGEKPGYVEQGDHSDHMHGMRGVGGTLERRHEDKVHLSSMSPCPGGRVEVGDKWSVTANYNMTRYSGMEMGGQLQPVMGISLMYVALDTK